jgi:polar amino acid transport system permease protein
MRARTVNRLISAAMILVALAVGLPWLKDRYDNRPPWWDPVWNYIFHTGLLKETLRMAVISVLGAASIGIVLGTLLTIRFLPSRALIRGYIEVWRGLPIIVTIFLIYFALPQALPNTVANITHISRLAAFQAATVGLILWGSAQVAEATRGAVESIPNEQHEAAAALGFGWVGRHRYVILPQAVRRLLPPLISLLVNVIQNTTVAGLIGVGEVLENGNRSTERLLFSTGDSHAFPIFAAVMAVFFVISFPLTRLAAFLERRLI